MNSTQKIIINAGGVFIILLLVVSLLLDFFPLFLSIPLLLITLIIIPISYKIASDSTTNPVISKTREKITSIPFPRKKTKEDKENSQKLDRLATMTGNRLFKLSTVFPFDFFPDDVIIELKQIIIIRRNFFYSSQQYPFSIKDILAPAVESGYFFATLKLELGPGGFQQNPPKITYLKKAEAQRARRLIMGLIVCDKEDVELTGIPQEEVLRKVEEIGRFNTD